MLVLMKLYFLLFLILFPVSIRDVISSVMVGPVDSSADSRINYWFNLESGMLVHMDEVWGRNKFVLDLKRLCIIIGHAAENWLGSELISSHSIPRVNSEVDL